MTIELNDEALDHAATFAFELLNNQGWEPQQMSAQDIAEQIIRSYLSKKAELDSESEAA